MFGNKKNSKPPGGADANSDGNNNADSISTDVIRRKLEGSADVVYSDVIIGGDRAEKFTVVFIDGLVNTELVDNFVLKPLAHENILSAVRTEQELVDYIMLGAVYHCQRQLRDKLPDCMEDLLSGSVVLIFDQSKRAVTFQLAGFEKRTITEPTNENVLKGSKESFIEVLRTNTALIRRRIKTGDLKINTLVLGRRSHTNVAVIYLQGIANPAIIDKVKQRLGAIDIDSITTAGEIESFLLDNKYSFFPQLLYTERVDKFCANIMEGRIGIMTDGLPLAYIVPVDLNSFLQAPEDYALNYIQSSMFRLLRHVCAFVALTLPALYSAITTFHQEMIPTKLAVSIITSKQGVPLPTFLEVIVMLIAFEVLLEAGLRLPRAIGQTVSIVGAIVIGQAAITASILSPGVVIIISAAGICGFVVPSQDLSNAIRICRLSLVLLSITGGLFSVTIGLILILYHLCTLEIFGVPYMSPYVANEGKNVLGDTIFRKPWFKEKNRPANIGPQDTTRQGG